jgi:hypothetical protein
MLSKEHLFIIAGIAVLLYFSYRNWGKKYRFVGYSRSSDIVSSEDKCREIFEQIFKCPFIKIRPSFLINTNTGRNLELDGFNKNIITPLGKGLAFEYNGEQHYSFPNAFHQNIEEYEAQVFRDKLKKKLCRQHGIMLIEIPYTIRQQELKEFIVKKLRESGLYYYL